MTFKTKRLMAAATAVAMLTASTAASATPTAANPAASLSLAKGARAGTPTTKGSRLAEGATATYVSIGILAALVGIVLVATKGDDSDSN